MSPQAGAGPSRKTIHDDAVRLAEFAANERHKGRGFRGAYRNAFVSGFMGKNETYPYEKKTSGPNRHATYSAVFIRIWSDGRLLGQQAREIYDRGKSSAAQTSDRRIV